MILILVPTLSGCGGGKKGGGPGGTIYTPGQQSPPYTVGGVTFHMRYAPGGSFTSDDNTIRGDDNLPGGAGHETVTVNNPFWIAETEVTYELWDVVYDWARGDINRDGTGNDNGNGTRADGGLIYTFANAGVMGDGMGDGTVDTNQHPVTAVNWRDAMVWCNALTEYYYENSDNCVYYENAAYTTPIRSVSASNIDSPYIKAAATGNTGMANCSAKGFRLPTSDEWELAARYHFKDGIEWMPGDHVSGDATGYCYNSGISTTESSIFEKYAWYQDNSSSSTHPVATTELKNALNLSDMSGNVWEWCFDWYPGHEGSHRVSRGGSWGFDAYCLQLGFVNWDNLGDAVRYFHGLGFRPVRTQ